MIPALWHHPCLGSRRFVKPFPGRSIPSVILRTSWPGWRWTRAGVRLQTWKELDRYCYHVASVVGLIMVHVLTEPSPELLEPARDLGTAMQLTNILRDIHEDWGRGSPLSSPGGAGSIHADGGRRRPATSQRIFLRDDAFSGRPRPDLFTARPILALPSCPTMDPAFVPG